MKFPLGIVRLIALLAIGTGTAFPAEPAWETRTIDGREYVAVDGMKEFYHFDTLSQAGNKITLENKKLKVELRAGSQECVMNGVHFAFSSEVEDTGGHAWISRIDLSKLVDPVLRPSYIEDAGNFRTVVLDPGHGGKDRGATNGQGTEADYNLQVALRVKKLLLSRGYKVVMTREDDHYLTLEERVVVANQVKDNAIFISIHHNSGPTAAHGIETFTLSPTGVAHYGRGLNQSDYQERAGNSHDSANIALATAIHGCLSRHLGSNTFDRGIKRARFNVLTGVVHPAVLVECGFVTHPTEGRLVATEAYRNAVVTSIGEAVERYRRAVSPKPVGK